MPSQQQALHGLDNIPASAIEKIEIINNPSARYDANGMAGIINIVLKKEKKEGVVEKFKYERFDSFPGINEKISGFSSQNEPLKGVRM